MRRNPAVPRYRIELVRESSLTFEAVRLPNSAAVVKMLRSITDAMDRECFGIITSDSKNKVIGINIVSLGSLSESVVHPREVYKMAVLQNAASIVAFHNHPSGDPTPSREDAEATRRLMEAGKILGIRFLDHIVIGEDDYFSFTDAGVIAP